MRQLKDYSNLFSLTEKEQQWIDGNSLYVGDIHNHCGISYGYGTLEKAIGFAKSQLDFFSATGHFAWPDMESVEGMMIPPEVRQYHKNGFAKLRKGWDAYLTEMQQAESPTFIPFPSYEYHSFINGDYTVVAKEQGTKLPPDPPEGTADTRLEELIAHNDPKQSLLVAFPHHIGYKTGYRGINWKTFNDKTSPCVEILSMHGCAESQEARQNYLHTMGPRSMDNTMQGGLKRGFTFGVVANTDHHNASPGSYGFGRTGVYAPRLGREEIWNGILDKKTIAYSGDVMRMALFANDKPLGESVMASQARIDGYLVGFDKIDRFELVHDGKIVCEGKAPAKQAKGGFIAVAFGWGKKHAPCYWTIQAHLEGARILDARPRIRGNDMVDPLDAPLQDEREKPFFSFTNGNVTIKAATDGNRTASTNGCQGFVLETDSGEGTIILEVTADWNGNVISRSYRYAFSQLNEGPETEYVNGFVSPAVATGPFVPLGDVAREIHAEVREEGAYYLRAYQNNGDAAFSTPVWVKHD